eukprot:TRINITY_DN22120_c0_g1_i1.p1 TRINITY_DN22120_c0_g1~~TRINITY_DN22120_c0_g1_i1.p1  ORF type:complete len:326 (-),score=24.69 TRINITY_DN22120_c0_g1_i1:383-1360(-)
MPLLKRNLQRNRLALGAGVDLRTRVFEWGSDVSRMPKAACVFASDVCYNADFHEPFAKAVADLLRHADSSSARCWVVHDDSSTPLCKRLGDQFFNAVCFQNGLLVVSHCRGPAAVGRSWADDSIVFYELRLFQTSATERLLSVSESALASPKCEENVQEGQERATSRPSSAGSNQCFQQRTSHADDGIGQPSTVGSSAGPGQRTLKQEGRYERRHDAGSLLDVSCACIRNATGRVIQSKNSRANLSLAGDGILSSLKNQSAIGEPTILQSPLKAQPLGVQGIAQRGSMRKNVSAAKGMLPTSSLLVRGGSASSSMPRGRLSLRLQ